MKIAVSFANIFMADKKVIQQSETEPKEWNGNAERKLISHLDTPSPRNARYCA